MNFPAYYRRANEGVALIIVLVLLVLVTVSVLIELAVSVSQRSTSDNVASGSSAELLARSAQAMVVGQLIQEIHDGTPTAATNTIVTSGYTTYQPNTGNSFPLRMAVSGVATPLLTATTNMALVKESTRSTAFYSGSSYAASGATWASPSSTGTVSATGHSISSLTWNGPLLLPLKTLGSTTDYTPTNTYIVPDWVYVTRGGPKVLAVTDLPTASNAVSSNSSYVIGRFAFNVYDEGGLLDVAAAGFNSGSNVSAGDKARKGSIALADLTQIPNGTGTTTLTQTQVDALSAWRNASSYNQTGTSGYTAYVFNRSPLTAFLQPVTGDESFVSRQDLLNFWLSKISTSVDGLRFFTTFNRTVNAPAWSPRENAADFQESPNNFGNTDTRSPFTSYAYKNNSNLSTAFNRNLLGVRVQAAFTRLDGTTAVVGEPLIKTRFDLNRLAWITYNGVSPTGVAATDIYKYFGLTWTTGTTDSTQTSTGAWVYNHGWTSVTGDTSDIMTLAQVAAAGREPDFFELLKAGILQGSLGLYSGNPTTATTSTTGGELWRISNPQGGGSSITVRTDVDGNLVNQMEKYQTIQIGANLVDQYSTDNYPTLIQLGTTSSATPLTFAGIKNLPYLNTISERFIRPPNGSTVLTPNAYQGYVHAWLCFSLWNPHMNAGTAAGGPTSVRILVRNGTLVPKLACSSGNAKLNLSYQARDFSASPGWIQLSLADYPGNFASPTEPITTDAHIQTSEAVGLIPSMVDAATDFNDAGIYVGWNNTLDPFLPSNDASPLMTAFPAPQPFDSAPATLRPTLTPTSVTYKPFTVELQYQGANGNWYTYETMPSVVIPSPQHGMPFIEPKDPAWNAVPLSTNNESVNYSTYFGTVQGTRGAADLTFGYLDPRSTRVPPSSCAGPANHPTPTPGVNSSISPIATQFYSNVLIGSIFNLLPLNYTAPHFTALTTPSWWVFDDNFPVTATTGVFSASGQSYTDRDYVRRLGDAAGYAWTTSYVADTTNWKGLDPLMLLPPYTTGQGGLPYRPIVLGRPFHSVGEMGYAFRDLPWKSLDFFTNKSADAALLDLFCLGAAASSVPTAPTPSVIAGTVNINSAPKEVLVALLNGAGKTLDPTNANNFTATLSTADALTIAQAYISYLQTTGPMFTPADLPRPLPQVTLYNGSNVPTKATANSAFPGVKTSRELPVRAFGSSVSMRTWNVLIDVVAQSGRFTSNATTLDQFTDKGERRYWFHVAIDRYTGKIVDQKIEFVPQ